MLLILKFFNQLFSIKTFLVIGLKQNYFFYLKIGFWFLKQQIILNELYIIFYDKLTFMRMVFYVYKILFLFKYRNLYKLNNYDTCI